MALREAQARYPHLTLLGREILSGSHRASHLEIKGFVTVENQDKASKLMAQSFDRLGLPSPGRPCDMSKVTRPQF